LEEIKARGGPVIAIYAKRYPAWPRWPTMLIRVPDVEDFLQPIVSVITLQLLAYTLAVFRGWRRRQTRN